MKTLKSQSIEEPVHITQNAADKIWELIQEEQNLNLKLRVFITGGGCSGFQYGFTFDEKFNEEEDFLITRFIPQTDEKSVSVELLVDHVSLDYLRGAEIDYQSDLSGERFIIRNPNAKTTCGCGSSFSI